LARTYKELLELWHDLFSHIAAAELPSPQHFFSRFFSFFFHRTGYHAATAMLF